MQTPSRTTELEAVNVCLSLMGQTPVSSLVAPYGADVANARTLITEESKNLQADGWKFNKWREVTLAREVGTNKIPVANNVVSVDADTDSAVDVIFKAGYLYDLKNNTDVFDHDVVAEIKYYFAFDELPETARRFIMISAARKFQVRYLGSENQEAFTQRDESRAWTTFLHDQAEQQDANILNGPDQAYIARRWGRRRYSW